MQPGHKIHLSTFLRMLNECIQNPEPDKNVSDLEKRLQAGEEIIYSLWHPELPNYPGQGGFSLHFKEEEIEVPYGPRIAELILNHCGDNTYYRAYPQ